ncbi:MAG: FAD-dependent oxidoreductase [Deltaproteobacteria bacterium]|nr:FAD-dependent oxidoreductase [Deltaproteobacteria bacterium]
MKQSLKLLERDSIGTMELKNRMAYPPVTTGFGAIEGCFGREEIDYMVERAKGGAALIFTDGVSVDRDHQLSVGMPLPYLDSDELIAKYTWFVDAIHHHGAKTCIQLYHAGRQTTLAKRKGEEPVAPSAMPSTFLGRIPFPDAVEMSSEGIEKTILQFALAASRAKCAGFDAVDLDGGAGYLIAQFMSPHTNRRNDKWGGSLVKRMRYPLAIVRKVKDFVGDDYPLIFDLPMDEYIEGGITPEESLIMAEMLEDAGINAFRIHPALFETYHRVFPTMATPRGVNAPLGRLLKKKVKKAKVMLGQRINDPDVAEKLLKDGCADFVLLGRALIADPYFPKKVMQGEKDEIRKCIGCCHCLDNLASCKPIRCSVNAEVGFEMDYKVLQSANPRKVLVVGGGPSGMEAARVAAMRGHMVVLCETQDQLGGQIVVGSVPPHKEELENIIEYLKTRLNKLNIEIRLNTEVNKDVVKEINPDVVIIATGAKPIRPKIQGSDKPHVFMAEDILKRPQDVTGKKVVIVGGGTVGAEIGELLAERGKIVTILEMTDAIAPDMGLLLSLDFHPRLDGLKIVRHTNATVTDISGDCVNYTKNGQKNSVTADAVVIAAGYKADRDLYHAIENLVEDTVMIGDCNAPRKIFNAIHEGYHAARMIE